MRKFFLFFASLFAAVVLISSGSVQAQTVMWVSATGSGSTCSTTSPCGTFQAAIGAGATEIHCLNSGNYGAVTIATSIVIDCGAGNVGNISPTYGNNAVTINGISGIKIVLRHLSMNGLGVASIGIAIGSGFTTGQLIIEDCTVEGFGTGLNFSSTSGRSLVDISNSRFLNSINSGIYFFPSGTSTIETIALNNVEVSGSGSNGIWIGSGSGVVAGTIRNSLILGNALEGIETQASQVYLTVETSTINANEAAGIHANSSNSNITVFATTIGANGAGLQAPAGSIISFGNNGLGGNAVDGSFTSTTTLK